MQESLSSLEGVERHLLTIGTSLYYTEWVYHGESLSFRERVADLQHCPTCGETRYKEESTDMRWHRDKRVETDDVLRHPSDAEGWNHFNSEFSNFASDPRNVRLGLASNGFNPFGKMSTSYSMWLVVLLSYNLPSWKCMKETSFFMSLLIPDPKSPGREIDVYLQPLIEELKELWTFGVRTYDSLTGHFFQLYAALLWMINDFPAYGDLSWWSTKGYQACPICMGDRSSFRIRGRISFIGHICHLLENHVWRRSRLHDGKVERRAPLVVMNEHEILEQLDQLEFPVMKVGNRLVKPHASYTLTSSERVEFCNWMYPIERSLCTLRQYVMNKARPNGSIAEAYVMNESSTFCSRYLSGIETRFTRDERIDDSIAEDEIIEVEDVENEHINILEVVVSHQVDDHIEDVTLCRIDVDLTIVERPVVRHVIDDFIDDVDEHLSHTSDDDEL
ncbi:uncharacterized protein E5676_scaffold85G00050 [Cucumis melo var. makuwa]|uniref:DUF4218 domain-containing protein n=1 Tax=Cucumis melo var. makuwa TaxID=1194695 RepID=A0A5D3BCD6_CUCMM|nr:uncharacterized protein E5676_scaffold85G00050 [Cucumis melo var. makuwa]